VGGPADRPIQEVAEGDVPIEGQTLGPC